MSERKMGPKETAMRAMREAKAQESRAGKKAKASKIVQFKKDKKPTGRER